MDGNLLDPDNADATLAKEWNLPELPADQSSSLPSSSQELADIFGGSDDEEDMDFPFSLNVGKTFPDLSLPDGREAEFFLNSLNSLSDIPVTMDSGLPSSVVQGAKKAALKKAVGEGDERGEGVNKSGAEGVKHEDTNEKGDVSKECGSGEGGGEEGKSEEVTMSKNDVEAPKESAESAGQSMNVEEQKPTRMMLRKSSRLHRKLAPTDMSELNAAVKEEVTLPKVESEPLQDGEEKVKNEKIADSFENEKYGKDPKFEQEDLKGKVKEEQEEEKGIEEGGGGGEEEEEEEEDDDDEGSESDDPDRLWCICQQPHDDRFMICCDLCEEWYHGSCVGISVSQGKRMEREGKEYTCPICVEKEKQAKAERELDRSARIGRRDLIKEKDLSKKLEQSRAAPATTPGGSTPVTRRRSSSVKEEGVDQYGLSQLFQPDNAPKGTIKEEVSVAKTEDTSSSVRTKFKEVYTGSCIGPDCNKPTIPPSVYCGENCIEKHASYSIRKLSERGISFHSNPSEFVKGSGGVSVIEKATGKMLVGIAAPSEKNLVPWLKTHTSYQILLHKKGKGGKGSKKQHKVKQEVKKEAESTSTFPKISLMDPASVRANAKRALYQILWKRCEDAADMANLEQSRVEAIAHDIEEKLHQLHRDINPKYKNKYRSLVFNLKDVKNQGLFRKVVLSEVTPHELVRMTTEKLASDELAQWREKTIKKNLDMIKVREEEAGTLGKVIRKFTYKGEVEIDVADDSKIDTMEVTQKNPTGVDTTGADTTDTKSNDLPATSPKAEPSSKPKSHSKSHSDSKSSGGGGGGGILDLLGGSASSSLSQSNTTSQHGSHVYDQYCDICTGKQSSGKQSSFSPPPPSSPQQDSSTPPQSPEPEAEAMDVETAGSPEEEEEEEEKEKGLKLHADQVIWKGFVNMSGLAKFSTCACPVSGPMDNLDELLPDTLHVMGRIAYVQVWDYLDKLRSSTTRDIVVLNFTVTGDEVDSYMSMLTYLVKKHRCGVINCCFPGMKDMYLVPLQGDAPIPPQLLPLDGPGLPVERKDMLLGVIVRSKVHRGRLNTRSPPHSTQKITAEICIKRHYSASMDDADTHSSGPAAKRPRMAVEVGVNGETPPRLSGFQDDNYQESPLAYDGGEGGAMDQLSGDDENETKQPKNEKVSLESQSSTESSTTPTQNIQVSFYGKHRPLDTLRPEAQSSAEADSKTDDSTGTTSAAPSSTLPPTNNLSNILSQLSDEKLLKDLASAVSSITNKPPILTSSTSFNSTTPPPPPPPPLPPLQGSDTSRDSGTVQHPDYGANTPPPEDVIQAGPPKRLPRVAGGPPFPQQIQTSGNQAPPPHTGEQYHQGLPQQHGNANPPEWNKDRERFANTPPPDFQPYPQQQQPGQQPRPQETPYQQQQYHDNYNINDRGQVYPPQQQQGPPQTYYNNYPSQQRQYGGQYPQQDNWEYKQEQDRYPHDPRFHGHRAHHRGDRERGGGYGDRDRNMDRRGEKYRYGRGGRRFPAEWYRD